MRFASLASLLLLAACDSRPREWTAWVYPDPVEHPARKATLRGFKNFEQCQEAALSTLRSYQYTQYATYECGYRCAYDPQINDNICAEVRK
jgi:hypothetical protein